VGYFIDPADLKALTLDGGFDGVDHKNQAVVILRVNFRQDMDMIVQDPLSLGDQLRFIVGQVIDSTLAPAGLDHNVLGQGAGQFNALFPG